MSDPDCAARDPIFWLHHSNIDRLWKRWLDVEGHADPVQARWLDRPFRFYDPARQEIRAMTSREVLDTVEQLGYGYDDDPPAAVRPVRRAAAPEPVAAMAAGGRRELGSTGPVSVAGRPVQAAGDLAGPAGEGVAAEPVAAHLNLNLEGVERDPGSALLFEVYLNLPAEAPPDPGSPYYVGHFAFFGHMAHGHAPAEEEQAEHAAPEAHEHRGNTFTFDITRLVDQQRAGGIWSGRDFAVTVVPGGYRGPGGRASVAAAAQAEAPQMGEVRISRVTISAE
jgi:tyrosinase